MLKESRKKKSDFRVMAPKKEECHVILTPRRTEEAKKKKMHILQEHLQLLFNISQSSATYESLQFC